MKPPLRSRIHSAMLAVMGVRLQSAYMALMGIRGAWQGAEVNRLLMDWITGTKTADEEIKGDIRRLRARGRDQEKNNGYIRQYLMMTMNGILGAKGFKHQPQVRDREGKLDKETNRTILGSFAQWAKGKVTVDQKHTLRGFERLLVKTVVRDGEVFVRMFRGFLGNPFGFAFQAIDADMVDETYNVPARDGKNEIRMGIEIDSLGAPVRYWINEDPNPGYMYGNRKRYSVPAEEMIHLGDPDRINQTRYVTWLAAVLPTMKMLDGYEEAELVASRTAAAKMGWIQSRPDVMNPGAVDQKKKVKMQAAPGAIDQLPVGWEFASWDPQHPTTAFGAMIKTILRKASGALTCAYNVLANNYEDVNYSSLKGAQGEARDVYRAHQQWWIESFRDAFYPVWMSQATLTGMLVLPSRDYRKYTAVKWGPRGWPWLEPLKEIQAAFLACKAGLGARTIFLSELGLDFEEVCELLAQEKEIAEEKGIEIEGIDIRVEEDDDDDGSSGDGKKRTNGKRLVFSTSRS